MKQEYFKPNRKMRRKRKYDDFEYGKWLNRKLYCTAKQDWKWMLLENWDEISKKYDKLKFQGMLDWKIYHVAKENDKWKILEDGKEILIRDDYKSSLLNCPNYDLEEVWKN